MPLWRILYRGYLEHATQRPKSRERVETSRRPLLDARKRKAQRSTNAEQGVAMEYVFTLKYQLAAQDADFDEIVERLGEAGCDDALVGIGQPGRIALEFTREAESAEAALLSALANVRQAIPTAKLIEAAPDFVGLTDAAQAVGVTRQNMRKLMITHATSFPTPVHEGTTTVWHLADILAWLQAKGSYSLEKALVEVAATAMQVNLAKQVRQIAPRMQRELNALVA
jgi:predicted DNA-binding transcriptional regulator AlpA